MKARDYEIRMTVNATANEVFKSISSISKWWTEDTGGGSQKLDDEFTVRFGDVHFSKQKLIAVIPDEKVVWLVTDSKLNFLKNKQEWTNTIISFELFEHGQKTQIHFKHIGLVPEYECYDACSNAWSEYLQGSLLNLINTGKGQPNLKNG
jgi:hypothetical protein